MNRRRPSRPSINEENDKIKTNDKENLKEVSSPKNVRVRSRVRGSVLRPRSKQNSETSPEAVDEVIRRRPQRMKTPEKTITTVEDQPRDAPDLAYSKQDEKATPRLRVRTRTRISSASLPNTLKGEQSSSRQRTRVRRKYNIRQSDQ